MLDFPIQAAPPAKMPRLETPSGACDCHVHVDDAASFDAYRAVKQRLGLSRAVVVQSSPAGTGPLAVLEAVAALGGEHARCVLALAPDISEAELERLADAGARGVRLRLGSAPAWEAIDALAARIAPLGWHLQLAIDGQDLADLAPALADLPCPVVLEHFAHLPEGIEPGDPALRALLRLIGRGRTWLELSAPYEILPGGGPRYAELGRVARALVRAAPERMIWGSNGPHSPLDASLDDADLIDLLLDWAPEEGTRRRILVVNPASLYGF